MTKIYAVTVQYMKRGLCGLYCFSSFKKVKKFKEEKLSGLSEAAPFPGLYYINCHIYNTDGKMIGFKPAEYREIKEAV